MADKVILLDENTANRIAAGEVVERPSSALKELVENAIDAGATRIQILLEEGGKRLISVFDNGCGMSRNDAILAMQRHATSKINSADDLFALQTLGFRGEALPSIASVSNFTLSTCVEESEGGIVLEVEGGEIVNLSQTVTPRGTRVEVRNLFFNTPARLKFLKSDGAESSRALDIAGQLAIGYPHISFQLKHGSQELLSTPGDGQLLSVLAVVWGREVARRLAPVSHDGGSVQVRGYISTPEVTRPGRTHELFFVNGRPVKSRLISHALEDAFRSLTPDMRYPLAALIIDMPAECVDVNVHPTKTEVKFTRDGDVHHAVSQAVKKSLMEVGILPAPNLTVPHNAEPTADSTLRQSPLDAFADFAPSAVVEKPLFSTVAGSAAVEPAVVSGMLESRMPLARPFGEMLREFQVLGQMRNTYIVAMTSDGLAVIDQHVAHERVLYERLTLKRAQNGIASQQLATPATFSLERREALALAENCAEFQKAGWEIEPFGADAFVIRAVPALLSRKPYEQILRDMIDELVNHTVSRRLLLQQDLVTVTNACKMAVKAGDPLTMPEMQGLLEQLSETENPYLCPHGRPIVVQITLNELDKQFKRI